MLKKLRVRFILINMALVSAVLVAVFAAVCLTNYRGMERQRDEALHIELKQKRGEPTLPYELFPRESPDGKAMQRLFMPSFVVELNEAGAVTFSRGNVQVADDVRDEAVRQALESGKDFGTLGRMALCFLVDCDSAGTRIAFVDISAQRRDFQTLVLTFAIALIAAQAVFLGISMVLARWSLRPVERAWQQQQRFIADASHELKTPLTVILANIGILRSRREDSINSQMRWLDATQEEGLRMKGLIDDMLFLARSDSAEHTPELARVDVSELAQSCALTFEPVAFENSVSMEYSEIEPGVSLQANEGQLRRLINILIDNACKYAGEHGKVAITLKNTAGGARLCVKNTGAAIPADALPRIFERFYRAEKSRSREKGGYGLGLSIADSIAKAMNAKITAQSGDFGTEFCVTFIKK